ncbi:MAG: Ig-like domain-containing protein, partial [Candidatus Thermoplasmatota archaeon]|nr:Ig-like domain-containing protein [Candidatus Thermoplasmatota archaeon]
MRRELTLLLVILLLSTYCFSLFSVSQNTSKNDTEWSADVKLSGIGWWCESPDIVTNQNNVYVIFDSGDPNDLLFRHSLDNGITWSPEKRITYSGGVLGHPKIAWDAGTLHAVWWCDKSGPEKPEIYYKHSSDNGLTWSEEVALTVSDGEFSWQPDIAVNGSFVHVVWSDSRDTGSVGLKEIYYRRSTNGGGNWSGETRLTNDPSDSATPLIVAQGSTVYIIFADNRDGDYEAFYIRSDDNGGNWTVPQRITSADGVDSAPFSLAVNGNNLYLVGRDERWVGGNPYYSIWFMNSTDNGDNWSDPIYVVPEQECVYVDQPTITADGENIHLVWVDNRDNPGSPDSPPDGPCEIYYKNSSDGGSHWSNDTRLTNASGDSLVPVIAYSNNNVHVVWQDKRTGNYEVFYKRSSSFPNISKPEICFTPLVDVYANETISITANITSNTTMKSAYLCYRNNTNVPYTIVNMTQTKNSYEFVGVIPAQVNNTTIYYYIWVIDNNNHQNYTNVFNFTVKDENIPPVIISHSPMGDNVSVNTSITVTFNETMNKTSVENAFLVSPVVDGDFTWNSNNLIFTPLTNLSYNTTYNVTITTNAKDVAGNHLESNYSWEFITEKESDTNSPTVIGHTPIGESIPINTNITVTFNES